MVCRSHFHEVFIPKLLSTALKEYTAGQAPGGWSGDSSVMTPTMVQVLTYLSLQHSHEIKSNLLALFHVGEVKFDHITHLYGISYLFMLYYLFTNTASPYKEYYQLVWTANKNNNTTTTTELRQKLITSI